ncbi:MAG: Fe-S cluster assembly protein SufD [Pseudomonadota bacterium]
MLEALLAHEPAPVADWWAGVRSDHRALLERQGLPGRKQENWKYTSLRRLEKLLAEHVVEPAADKPKLTGLALPGFSGEQLVFVDGKCESSPDEGAAIGHLGQHLSADDAQLKVMLEKPFEGGDEGFAALNTALADDGAVLRIPAGAVLTVDLLAVHTGAAQAVHLRHLIHLEADAQLVLIDRTEPTHEGAAGLVNHLTQVELGSGARLHHVRIPPAAPQISAVHRVEVAVASGARYESLTLDRGGALVRHDQNIVLAGSEAEASLAGVYALAGESHVDNHCLIHHAGEGASSNQWFKGVLGDRSRAVFNGKVLVGQGADGTDARQSNATLLLSADAEIDTKPELEIYAEDVKCAHGATVGELSDKELFYLRSRGIPEAQARQMLVAGFCREVLADADESVREHLISLLENHLDGELNS